MKVRFQQICVQGFTLYALDYDGAIWIFHNYKWIKMESPSHGESEVSSAMLDAQDILGKKLV